MEAALRSLLKDAISDYVQKGLEQVDTLSFPMEIRDVELNAKRLNHALHESPMDLTHGKIGSVKIIPGWMGNLDVAVTDIELKFSFSPTKAMRNGMRRNMDDSEDAALAAAIAASMEEQQKQASVPAPPLPCPPPPACPPPPPCPRFCSAHDKSEKRVKSHRQMKPCSHCNTMVESSYRDFRFCTGCSNKLQKCAICGSGAMHDGGNVPTNCGQETPRRPHVMKQAVASQHHGAAWISSESPSIFEGVFGNLSGDWWKLCADGNGVLADSRPPLPKHLQPRRTPSLSHGGA